MKNFLFTILIAIIAAVFLNCSSETEENKKLDEAKVELNNTDSTDLQNNMNNEDLREVSFHLAYKFKKGESFNYRLTTLSSTERDIVSDSVIIDRFEQKITRIINFEILSINKDSIAEIRCNISKVSVDVNLNNQKTFYQSGMTTDPSQLKKFIEHEGLLNNPFQIRITKYGEILEVYKVGDITNRYLELSGLKDSIRAEDKPLMVSEIKNQLLKPLVAQVLREFPVQELQIESTWEKTMEPASIMVFKIHYTDHFTVNKLEIADNDKLAVIIGKATALIEGEKEHTNNGVKYEFSDPLTDSNGKIFFNIDKGLVQKSNTTTNLKLSYRMEVPSPEGIKMGKSSESITNTNTLELL